MTIFKYPIEVKDRFYVDMPAGARILSVQVQHNIPQIWAVVDVLMPKVERAFWVRGTGHELGIAAAGKFVGTFQLDGGSLVFHLFDGGEV